MNRVQKQPMAESERLSARSNGPSSHIADSSVVISSLLPQVSDGGDGQPLREVHDPSDCTLQYRACPDWPMIDLATCSGTRPIAPCRSPAKHLRTLPLHKSLFNIAISFHDLAFTKINRMGIAWREMDPTARTVWKEVHSRVGRAG
jgi:hypothetical protein